MWWAASGLPAILNSGCDDQLGDFFEGDEYEGSDRRGDRRAPAGDPNRALITYLFL